MQPMIRPGSVFALATLFLAGCGLSGPTPPVKGKITLDGEPLNHAMLVFTLRDSPEVEATVPVQNGRFEWTSESGIVSGTYDVCIVPNQPEFEEVTAAVQSGSELPIKEVYLPPKFQQPGSMVAEIDANSPKELDFKLWSEGR